MQIAVYTLTSPLHDEVAVDAVSKEFISNIESILGLGLDIKGHDFSEYGSHDLDIIFVRTGGTEGLFKEVFPSLSGKILLLTSGKSNSLAASMEIMSYLNQQGREGEILHGSPEYIADRIRTIAKVSCAREALYNRNLGIIGQPSDWLISSEADVESVHDKLGINLLNIDMEELISEIGHAGTTDIPSELKDRLSSAPENIRKYAQGALNIYAALKALIKRHDLSGLTLRCFDLLSAVGNTGCLALALLNAEGIPAGCEGDVPALLTMAIGEALTGSCGFQANPSRIDPVSGDILLAHCTVPFNMVRKYSFNTHFESGIGIAIHGELPTGDATIVKISGGLSLAFCHSAQLTENQYKTNRCRTQIILKLDGSSDERKRICKEYFLTNPIGNHHIVFTGRHQDLFKEFLDTLK